MVSWVVWPDRETAATALKGMFETPRREAVGDMPFDGRRMILGGFEPLLVYRRETWSDARPGPSCQQRTGLSINE